MKPKREVSRREFLADCGRGIGLLCLGGVVAGLGVRNVRGGEVWQIDPDKCTQCGLCATACVLDQSATRCFHEFRICGYCDYCTGFFETQINERNEGAENQICPAGAIRRAYVTDPYFQYEIDEDLCVACGRCVKGCGVYGNGSLYLQIRHDICKNCNQCSIAAACPAHAIVRVPANQPYIPRKGQPL